MKITTWLMKVGDHKYGEYEAIAYGTYGEALKVAIREATAILEHRQGGDITLTEHREVIGLLEADGHYADGDGTFYVTVTGNEIDVPEQGASQGDPEGVRLVCPDCGDGDNLTQTFTIYEPVRYVRQDNGLLANVTPTEVRDAGAEYGDAHYISCGSCNWEGEHDSRLVEEPKGFTRISVLFDVRTDDEDEASETLGQFLQERGIHDQQEIDGPHDGVFYAQQFDAEHIVVSE